MFSEGEKLFLLAGVWFVTTVTFIRVVISAYQWLSPMVMP